LGSIVTDFKAADLSFGDTLVLAVIVGRVTGIFVYAVAVWLCRVPPR